MASDPYKSGCGSLEKLAQLCFDKSQIDYEFVKKKKLPGHKTTPVNDSLLVHEGSGVYDLGHQHTDLVFRQASARTVEQLPEVWHTEFHDEEPVGSDSRLPEEGDDVPVPKDSQAVHLAGEFSFTGP